MPRSRAWLVLGLLAACAQSPQPPDRAPAAPVADARPADLGPLPATFVNKPACEGCLAITLTLRPDQSFLVRERLGTSEFYDFGKWRLSGNTLELAGGRDKRQHAVRTLARQEQVEALRGPFRLVGLYDGRSFRDCLTGLAWTFAPSRSAERLTEEVLKLPPPQLVAIDARFEGAPEALLMQRQAVLLHESACPTS